MRRDKGSDPGHKEHQREGKKGNLGGVSHLI